MLQHLPILFWKATKPDVPPDPICIFNIFTTHQRDVKLETAARFSLGGELLFNFIILGVGVKSGLQFEQQKGGMVEELSGSVSTNGMAS